MSNYQFNRGQQVMIACDHGHLIASDDTMYQVGAINRVQGTISVQLLQEVRVWAQYRKINLKWDE